MEGRLKYHNTTATATTTTTTTTITTISIYLKDFPYALPLGATVQLILELDG